MASPFTAKESVLAVPATPPRYSLFTAATLLKDDGTRWQGGVAWAPEQNNGGGVAVADCGGTNDTLDTGDNITTAFADPIVVWAEDHCSTFGWQARDYEGRARRQLEATQSYRAANELWLGTKAQAVDLDNHWFTEDPEILSTSTFDAIPALALMDLGLGQMLAGRRGMIHVSPQLLTLMDAGGGLTKSGDLWVTAMGNVIVADAGYPGTKPAAETSDTQWIYGTPMISYRLSPIDIIPGSLDQARAEATDRSTNLTTIYAERLVLLQWDNNIPVGNHSNLPVLTVETTVPAFAFAA